LGLSFFQQHYRNFGFYFLKKEIFPICCVRYFCPWTYVPAI